MNQRPPDPSQVRFQAAASPDRNHIILRSRDRVKVLDFGIARPLSGGTLTMTGGFLGTLAYAAPEQATGKSDHRTDIYALGATLYHTLIGRPPFEGGLIEALAQPGIPVEPISHLPQRLIEVLRRCLARDPDDRFQSAGMLAGAEGPTGAVSTPPPDAVKRPPAPPTEVATTAAAAGQLKDFDQPVSIYHLGEERFPPLKTISNLLLVPPWWQSSPEGLRVAPLKGLLAILEQHFAVDVFTWPGSKGGPEVAPTWEAVTKLLSDQVTRGCHILDCGLGTPEILTVLARDNSARSLVLAGMTLPPATYEALERTSDADATKVMYSVVLQPG